MSSLNQATVSTIDSQLFSDISPQQAAIVEGGLQQVTVMQLRCIEAGGGSDRVFATFNGADTSFGRSRFMQRGSLVANFSQSGGSGSSVRVRLRDKSNGNASLGSFVVTNATRRSTRRISGNGSIYEVDFSAF